MAAAVLAGVTICGEPQAWAQEKASAPAPRKIAIKAHRMLDVRSGRTVSDAVVLVEGERIQAVGEKLAIGPDFEVLDLGATTLLPGLIDVHSHLLANLGGSYRTMLLTKSQAYRALEGAAHARRTVLAGFTTVRGT
jgi:imidazolonepropionase-like amidohydrolase